MCRIVFECMDQAGRPFTVNVESDSDAINDSVSEIVAANRRCGIEVISASRVEEMLIDLPLHAQPARRPAMVKPGWNRFLPTLPARLFTRTAAFGSLVLSVIGFDDGFSAASIVSHVDRLMPAMERVIRAIV